MSTRLCDLDPDARLVCNRASVNTVPWAAAVVVTPGTGPAPLPAGGSIVAGPYQLVSETVYGTPEPNNTSPAPGDRVARVLGVDCDVAYELYTKASSGDVTTSEAGNNCWRLDSDSVPSLSRFVGPRTTDLSDRMAYTARGRHLLLHRMYPYRDELRGNILGSYTYVDDFVLAPASASDYPTEVADAGAPPPPLNGRDPRCPANPPTEGDPCSPQPAPLECEYGGDPLGRCTTFAECALSLTDGAFRFRVDPPSACASANPAGCPATFSAAKAMAAQDPGGSVPTCYYAEGACGCVVFRGDPGAKEPPTCNWMCRSGTGRDDWLKPGCPWPRPLAGEPCPAGLECDYHAACSGEPSLGPAMICENGHWAELGVRCF